MTLFTFCKKEATKPTEKPNLTPITADYLPLSVGNYWVYQYYRIDADGVESEMNYNDSIAIVKDTVIDGETFYIKEGNRLFGSPWERLDILRDSSANLIDHTGKILFSGTNFTDTLNFFSEGNEQETYYTISYKMEEIEGEISYPAGNFNNVLDYRGTLTGISMIPPEPTPNPRYMGRLFAPNIGEISYTNFYFNSSNLIIRKLSSYHIE